MDIRIDTAAGVRSPGIVGTAIERRRTETGSVREAQFDAMLRGLRRTGGLVAADALAGMMLMGRSPAVSQPISRLARWIVAGQVVSVQWRCQTLLPLFQFEPGLASLRPGLAAVLAELADVFDGWETLSWFASANGALQDVAPADLLAERPLEVWQAARTDRFIATGG